MRKDAELHAEEDKQKKELAEAKNMADQLAYQSEKSLKEVESDISEDDKKAIEDAIAKVEAGATMVQLYSGLIYRGPALVREVAAALSKQPKMHE